MKVSLTTLGCKVNQFETSAIEGMLTSRGHEICPSGEKVDAVIINTCAVTAESGRKSRQAVRKAKRENPNAIVAVCGCFSQISPQQVSELGADMVYGSGQRTEFTRALEQVAAAREKDVNIDNPMKRREFECLTASSNSGRTRAYLKIQDGCDNFCAYCVIPYARGPVRSMPADVAVCEARKLSQKGYRELVITGIEIASYGKDLKDGGSLLSLTRQIAQAVPDIRLRLGSIEPRLITEEFCIAMAEVPRLCRHFHMSLQSGADATLKRMGRRYDTDRFYTSTELLRKYFPGCAITADLIVGFPGEGEDEFTQTMEFIKKCRFADMHVFPYSIRPGTKAAEMEGQIDKKLKAIRAKIAGAAAAEMRSDYLRSCIGCELEVLFEHEGDKPTGHADNYCLVTADGADRGELAKVLINGVSDEMLSGSKISSV